MTGEDSQNRRTSRINSHLLVESFNMILDSGSNRPLEQQVQTNQLLLTDRRRSAPHQSLQRLQQIYEQNIDTKMIKKINIWFWSSQRRESRCCLRLPQGRQSYFSKQKKKPEILLEVSVGHVAE